MKFSIITICRNSRPTIARTLESVLNQSSSDYEYFVIDGGSTDGTVQILQEYQPRFAGKMQFVSEPDKGIYDAFNKGIGKCNGEWIGIINSDDAYLPETLSAVATAPADADVAYGDIRFCCDDKTVVVKGNHAQLPVKPLLHPACFVRGAAYQKYGVFDPAYRIAADYELMLRYYYAGAVFAPLNAVLADFYDGGVSNRCKCRSTWEILSIQQRYGLISQFRMLGTYGWYVLKTMTL